METIFTVHVVLKGQWMGKILKGNFFALRSSPCTSESKDFVLFHERLILI